VSLEAVAHLLVVTLQITERADLKQTVKCLKVICITFKGNHNIAGRTMAVYLTENWTVGVRPIDDDFGWGR